ncbi:MAG: aldolase/citrate lyase family protein [Pseudolabrys sp.]
MAAFSLARRLRAGETVFTAWCTLASPLAAEVIAREGFASVVLDIQHGLWDTASLIAGINALHHAGAAAIVRVPLADFAMVSRALDFGAEAVIAPMINDTSDARALAAAAKFPPRGERSFGPQRAMVLQGRHAATDYLREANEETLTLAMIETPAALNDVEDIAQTDGIDALFVGPYDLSTALSGGRAQNLSAPEVERAIDEICAAATKAGKIPGIYCSTAERALAMAKRGYRFLAVGSDLGILRAGAAGVLKALKAT